MPCLLIVVGLHKRLGALVIVAAIMMIATGRGRRWHLHRFAGRQRRCDGKQAGRSWSRIGAAHRCDGHLFVDLLDHLIGDLQGGVFRLARQTVGAGRAGQPDLLGYCVGVGVGVRVWTINYSDEN